MTGVLAGKIAVITGGTRGLGVSLVGSAQLLGNTIRWVRRRAAGVASRYGIQLRLVPRSSEAGSFERSAR